MSPLLRPMLTCGRWSRCRVMRDQDRGDLGLGQRRRLAARPRGSRRTPGVSRSDRARLDARSSRRRRCPPGPSGSRGRACGSTMRFLPPFRSVTRSKGTRTCGHDVLQRRPILRRARAALRAIESSRPDWQRTKYHLCAMSSCPTGRGCSVTTCAQDHSRRRPGRPSGRARDDHDHRRARRPPSSVGQVTLRSSASVSISEVGVLGRLDASGRAGPDAADEDAAARSGAPGQRRSAQHGHARIAGRAAGPATRTSARPARRAATCSRRRSGQRQRPEGRHARHAPLILLVAAIVSFRVASRSAARGAASPSRP